MRTDSRRLSLDADCFVFVPKKEFLQFFWKKKKKNQEKMALPNFRQPVAGGQSGPIGGAREYPEYIFPYAAQRICSPFESVFAFILHDDLEKFNFNFQSSSSFG